MKNSIYVSKIRKLVALLLSVLFMYSCAETEQNVTLSDQAQLLDNQNFEPIPGRYIVVLNEENINFRKTKDYESAQAGMRVLANGFAARYSLEEANIDQVYGSLLTGFTAELTPDQVKLLENDPRVDYIEQDGYVYSSTSQSNATWGLDRIDQVSLPLNSTYTYNATGQGVTAYIIDTGILTAHTEFGGRAVRGFDAFGGNSEDCNGHGTHVAGTVGGNIYGVAKGVKLVGVRVLDCGGSGSWSGVIAGMDWVASNASGPSVANMSLGGGVSTSINDAVNRMYSAGIPVVVAAGNSNTNACNSSPASAANAYTVGATTSTDARASYSNYGNCVDIFAPGSSITAAWHTSTTAINRISGTSMASPHVAGVAALYLESNPTASAQAVYDFITTNSSRNKVTSSRSTNNHLVYSLGTGGTDPGDGGNTDPGDGDTSNPGDGVDEPNTLTLTGTGTKVQGRWRANLTWSGATTAQVDIFRNGSRIRTVNNTGSFTDQTNFRGGGSLTYKVCEAGTTNCSAEVRIIF